MVVREVRKADIGGKEWVLSLEPGKAQSEEFFAATNEQTMTKWINALKAVKERFYKLRLAEID
jgi:hypothetical protein